MTQDTASRDRDRDHGRWATSNAPAPHGGPRKQPALHLAVSLALLTIAFHVVFLPAQARTIYLDAAHVHLPKLRRILSFGGVLNGAPQDSIVSLDLSTTWKVTQPALTVLSPLLTEPASNLIPHVTRAADGTYTIILYGTTTGSPANAQNNKVKQWKITTKDGTTLDSIVPVDVGAAAWLPSSPCMSTTAAPLSEVFAGDEGVQEEVAVAYVYGGFPRNATETNGVAQTSLVLAELGSRGSGDAMKALPVGHRPGPRVASSDALAYISPKKLLVHAALNGNSSRVSNPSTFDIVNMRWDQYKGAYPSGSRYRNQFVLYPKSPSGRSYVLSVGSYLPTDSANATFSSIWYSELDGEKAWVNATVVGDPGSMFRHGAVVVDNQVVVMGSTSDLTAAQAATAVAVFTITEPNPGTLEFRSSDQFVALTVRSGGGAGNDEKDKPQSMSIATLAAVGFAALLGYVVYRRLRKPTPSLTGDPSPDSSTNKPDSTPTNTHVPAFPSLSSLPPLDPAAAAGTNGHSVSDEMLFGPPAHVDPAAWNRPPPAGFHMTAPFGSLPPAPPAPESVVNERVRSIILDGHVHGGRDWEEHEQVVLAPAPAALTGRP